MTNKLEATIRLCGNNTTAIDFKGDLTGFSENVLMDAYAQASGDDVKNILLNFSDLGYLNSSGIGLLVTMLIRAQRQKQKLMAFGLSDHYVEIFKLTRLDEAIGIHESEDAALAAV